MRHWLFAAVGAFALLAAPLALAEEKSKGESECPGFPDQIVCLVNRGGDRLFDKNMDAFLKALLSDRMMTGRGR